MAYCGGNWNNGGNAGVFNVNLNNPRSNSNDNLGFRSALPHSQKAEVYEQRPAQGIKESVPAIQKNGSKNKDMQRTYCMPRWWRQTKPEAAVKSERRRTAEKKLRVSSGRRRESCDARRFYFMSSKIKVTFDEVFSMESMLEALHNASKGRRYDPEVLRWNLESYKRLSGLQKEVYSGNYRIEQYHIFFIREPKKRMIMSIAFKHRIVQWCIYQKIHPLLVNGYIKDTYGCIPGRGAQAAVKRVRYWIDDAERKGKKLYYLKFDISKYFYRVDHKILEKLIRKKIKDKRPCDLLASIINCEHTAFGLPPGKAPEEVPMSERLYDVGMPIGNLMSQIFANFYLNELDQFCKRVLGIEDYIRYMDDGLILSEDKEELRKWEEAIRAFLKEQLHLDLNSKTCIRPVSQGIEFIGYRIWPGYTTVRKSSSKHMKRYLVKIESDYRNGDVTMEEAREVYMCYKAILEDCDCEQLRDTILGGFVLTRTPEEGEQAA